MTDQTKGDLKPCPFCGAGPTLSEFDIDVDGSTRWAVGCDCTNAPEDDPYAERYVQAIGNTRAQAIAAWNTRAAPTQPAASREDVALTERGLEKIRLYDAVRHLRDTLAATASRVTGYDWNADPDSITAQQGRAFAAADKVFADLTAQCAGFEISEEDWEATQAQPADVEGAGE